MSHPTQYYSAAITGYTDTCFLSRPLRSKRTIPSTLANKVSSPPLPTFSPGWIFVPRCV